MAEIFDNVEIPVKKQRLKEISRLSEFCLIDIRILFIVISVYSTVSSLIATTANNEATNVGGRIFNLSSHLEYRNVNVSSVSNAVLWSCREASPTGHYYKALYGILVGSFFAIVLVFLITRLTVMCGWRYRLGQNLHNILWQMVIIQRLKEIVEVHGPEDDYTELKADSYQEQWNNHKKVSIPWSIKSIPYFEALFLVLALPFIMTSYDLSPLACFTGPDESSIKYNSVTGRVDLSYVQYLVTYQKVAITLSFILMIPLVFFGIMLYCNYKSVVRKMTAEIDKGDVYSLKQDDSDDDNITLGFAFDILDLLTNTVQSEIENRMTGEATIPQDALAETIAAELHAAQ